MVDLKHDYYRLLRALGGRRAVPKGGDLDALIWHTLGWAAVRGAGHERGRLLRLIRAKAGATFFDDARKDLRDLEAEVTAVGTIDATAPWLRRRASD